MGGHDNGDVASQLAIATIQQFLKSWFENNNSPVGDYTATDCKITLKTAINQANALIDGHNIDSGYLPGMGMGTTLTGLWHPPGTTQLFIFNVGDSRVYLHREKKLIQLTKDHSYRQQWLDSGRQGPEPGSHLLASALGLDETVYSDVFEHNAVPGDLLLVCSDGLHDEISDDEIEDLLNTEANSAAKHLVDKLQAAALAAGGRDNISVVVVVYS